VGYDRRGPRRREPRVELGDGRGRVEVRAAQAAALLVEEELRCLPWGGGGGTRGGGRRGARGEGACGCDFFEGRGG
jgi:hypothetical protein